MTSRLRQWLVDPGIRQIPGDFGARIALFTSSGNGKTAASDSDETIRQQFVDAPRPNDAEDETPTSGPLPNRGHGTGTIGILAGPQVNSLLDTASGKSLNGEVLGGAPMMIGQTPAR